MKRVKLKKDSRQLIASVLRNWWGCGTRREQTDGTQMRQTLNINFGFVIEKKSWSYREHVNIRRPRNTGALRRRLISKPRRNNLAARSALTADELYSHPGDEISPFSK